VQLLAFFLVVFALIAARLVWVQGVRGHEYAEMGAAQRLREVEIAPRRGTIYDREGEPLAISVEAKTVFAAPKQVKMKRTTAVVLANALGGEPSDYLPLLMRDSGYAVIAKKVDLGTAARLKETLKRRELDGIGFEDDFRRMYPAGTLACQTLGFVDWQEEGAAGVERQYEDVLAGTPGVLIGEWDPVDRPIPGGLRKEIPAVQGHDIVLTLDKDIQYKTQSTLVEAVRKHHAKAGTAIVMNPKTGELYAVASYPTFNPNRYNKAKPEAIRNRAITDSYEPGSTLKCLTAAAVIEQRLYKPNSMFDLPSTIRVADRTIHESHGRGAVRWSLTDIVTHSSNVGTVKLGLRLGEKGLYDSFSAFGLTEKPGVDFPGEAKGWLPPTTSWSPSSIGNIPFGQGVSVTPLQLARAVGALANGGVLSTPHLLLDVPEAPELQLTWPQRSAVSTRTAAQVTSMLQSVVTSGTGTEAKVAGYSVAGKTGTAQKAMPGRGYVDGKFVGSFIGYLPADNPQVLVFVTLDEPTSGYYGGTCAAPSFSKIAAFSASHLRIPPANPKHKVKKGHGVGSVSERSGAQ
jgi:cell division protein FtsI/penicillin-binding protein 2